MSSASPATYTEGPRHAVITPDDHGALLEIAAWFLMVVMVLAIILRLAIRVTTHQVSGFDDAVLTIATCIGVGEVVALSLAVGHGFGSRIASLSSGQAMLVQKDIYIATLLYVLTLAAAKASSLLLMARIAEAKIHLRWVRGISAIVLLWTLASLLGVGFQCRMPHPWDYLGGKCLNGFVFWIVISAVDILVDVILIFLPVGLVWHLNMPAQRKFVVVVAFSFRALTVAAQIVRMYFLGQLQNTSDMTYDSVNYGIATQTHMTLAVVVTCIPAFKPFLDRAASGMMGISLDQRAGTSVRSGENYALQSRSKPPSAGSRQIAINSAEHGESEPTSFKPSFRLDRVYHEAAVSNSATHSRDGTTGHGSDDSRHQDDYWMDGGASDQIMIQKTTAWDVEFTHDVPTDRNRLLRRSVHSQTEQSP